LLIKIETIVVLALDEVLDNLFLIQCVGMTEKMESSGSPVETIDS